MLTQNNDFIVQHLNSIIHGDNMEVLKQFPDDCVDLIFADPPYNLGMKKPTVLDNSYRGGKTQELGVVEKWDNIGNPREYEAYTKKWLTACRRVLSPNGSIFISGTKHCIYTIAYIGQRLGYGFMQDIIWYKLNNRPNMHTRSLQHQHETIIWLTKNTDSKYTLNYHIAKTLGIKTPKGIVKMTQAGSVWQLPICGKGDRIYKPDGKAFHPTQKPWNLVKNIVLLASNKNELVLDPFSGSGTTCAVAKAYGRHYIGIEKEKKYIEGSRDRVNKQTEIKDLFSDSSFEKKDRPRKPKPTPSPNKRQVPYGSKKTQKTPR